MNAAALHLDADVERFQCIGEPERSQNFVSVEEKREVVFKCSLVDGDGTIAVGVHAHRGDGGLSLPVGVKIVSGSSRTSC